MTKLPLCVGLILALLAPAMAAWQQAPSKLSQTLIESISAQQSRSEKARSRHNQDQGDPYWAPCDYSCSWCTNGCG